MPSHVIHFLHDSVVAPSPAPVLGTAFDAADVHVHDLQAGMIAPVRANRNFKGIVEGIHVQVSNIAGASKITIRLCADAAGDLTLVPDTEATLVAGGIKVALLTTAFGLAIAIPMSIFHNYFVARIDGLVIDMEESAQKMVDALHAIERGRQASAS